MYTQKTKMASENLEVHLEPQLSTFESSKISDLKSLPTICFAETKKRDKRMKNRILDPTPNKSDKDTIKRCTISELSQPGQIMHSQNATNLITNISKYADREKFRLDNKCKGSFISQLRNPKSTVVTKIRLRNGKRKMQLNEGYKQFCHGATPNFYLGGKHSPQTKKFDFESIQKMKEFTDNKVSEELMMRESIFGHGQVSKFVRPSNFGRKTENKFNIHMISD